MRTLLSFVGLLSAALGAHAQAVPDAKPEKGSIAETRAKKSDWQFEPDPALPNVLILGDSISIGYTLAVRKALAGKANVFRPMAGNQPANCSGTTVGMAKVDDWIGTRKWSVIHFNWGLHDLKHVETPGSSKNSDNPADPQQATVTQYAENLRKIVDRLRTTGAKLIFATTTPVAPGTSKPAREPEAPPKYNAAALEIIKSHGIRVNDLFAFCSPQLEKLQLPKNVHFTSEGSQALAGEVTKAILHELQDQRRLASRGSPWFPRNCGNEFEKAFARRPRPQYRSGMSSLKLVSVAFQVVVALGLLNVWLLRARQQTPYRGGQAKTMAEEFAAYGLPRWLYYLVGAIKIGAGGVLLAGLWIPAYVIPASAVVCLLMGCAVGMHFKVGDPLKKSLPALLILAMSVCVLLAYLKAAQGLLPNP